MDHIEFSCINYFKLYVNPEICEDYKLYEFSSSIDARAPIYSGEYIIFDKQVMISYKQNFKVLQIFCGSLASKYAKAFDIARDLYYRDVDINMDTKKIILN